ncbi:hypothetical protein PV328_010130 [Microctonus aethiopoides]|uniref:Uncharacterized protein n=1 Tax=Microctonus aethiopoides TaxID=144406 RepID=A0AA39C789_9HYME|nr:hypothetical protein PV328_010130 [Microctonus aethiopoides]
MAGISKQISKNGEPIKRYSYINPNYDTGSSRDVYRPRNDQQENSYEIPENTDERQPSNGYYSGRSGYQTGGSSNSYGQGSYRPENSYSAYPRDNTRNFGLFNF